MALNITSILPIDAQGLRIVTRVLKENRKYLPRYAIAFGMMAVMAGLTAASAWILKTVVNDVFVAKNDALIWIVALSVFVIYAGRGLMDYAQTVYMLKLGREMTIDQQNRLYGHIMNQDMKFFNTASLGEVMVYFGTAGSTKSIMDLVLTSLGKDLLSVISLGAVMIAMDPVLSAIAFVVTPVALFGIKKIRQRIRAIAHAEIWRGAQLTTRLKDSILGIRVVKSFSLEDRMRSDMGALIETTTRNAMKIAKLSARSGPMMEALVGVALCAIILYAAYGVAGDARDPGSLLAFLAALLLTYQPSKSLARFSLNLETTLIGVTMMYDFLDKKLLVQDAPGAPALVVTQGSVEVRNVTFSYGANAALSGISVHFPAGKVSALVGSSGAGKSTLFSLIERFYDPDEGQVLIDGQDISKVTLASLRGHMALVTQDAFLFEGTIRENIASGRPGATEQEIFAAAEAANAHEFITEHPQGYDRQVGEGGGNLSGGQRQRITIARAMLRNAPILLLDEATSALDAMSEAKVREALDKLMKGRTTIVIAHRLSTVRKADVIHVIERGSLVESGTHDQLVALGGTYAQLSRLQLSADAGSPTPSDKTFVPAAE